MVIGIPDTRSRMGLSPPIQDLTHPKLYDYKVVVTHRASASYRLPKESDHV
jgi:hypothetical protein